ncbi:hypothetical protein DFH09DRAFT_1082135 [Mycena vulgaris]|nr:hypothetical protein DFH09DRAFT_1082135 [Mycena vulgaris]
MTQKPASRGGKLGTKNFRERLLTVRACTLTNKLGRSCQASDWSDHKRICGKALISDPGELSTQNEASFADDLFHLRKIGPALNGYQRSPALLRPIELLNTSLQRLFLLLQGRPTAEWNPYELARKVIQDLREWKESRLAVTPPIELSLELGGYVFLAHLAHHDEKLCNLCSLNGLFLHEKDPSFGVL